MPLDSAAAAAAGVCWRLAALAMVALSTCVSVGLMPQLAHGSSGVCTVAVCGSKYAGTGLEKEQMVQTHVA